MAREAASILTRRDRAASASVRSSRAIIRRLPSGSSSHTARTHSPASARPPSRGLLWAPSRRSLRSAAASPCALAAPPP
jgi:hypothetical protein